jgi:Response regulator containing a CheY-like receiver domain and an HTH DNA-binding domain
MMRRGLRDLLELEDDLELIGEAGNGEERSAWHWRSNPT